MKKFLILLIIIFSSSLLFSENFFSLADIATAKKILTGYNELLNSEIPELSMGGLSVVCSASNTYLELAKRYNIDPPNSINKTESSAGTLLDKMSNKEQERFKIILEYLVNHEFATKAEISDLLDVEEKTAQRLLAKAVELELLITEGEYKSTIYKVNPKL